LVERGLSNYWGYNTLAFFAPEPRYLGAGGLDELKGAIKALHAAGIEVLLDVVYNHTCEGSELGTTLSLRGLDNTAYYRHEPQELRRCVNYTGCGNTLNSSHPRALQLVLDSLRYWVQEFHIDGFRFDLSVTLGREAHGYDPGAGFFDALLQDPLLARVKLIAEPWDLGPDGFQLGNHPPGMAEWNSRFRDDVRRLWRGDSSLRGALAARLQGSADVFDHQRRRPWEALNFITAHDGFTLQDWVSYEHKHNEANGEDNRDGSDDNASSNWGVEGPSDDPAIMALRASVKRAMLATLLFSHGTPMLLSGDEFGHTQRGNNNPYCQDSELSWLDWAQAGSTSGLEQQLFVARLLHHLETIVELGDRAEIGDGFAALLFDLRDDLVGRAGGFAFAGEAAAEIVDDDFGAARCEQQRVRATEAAAGAGHDRDFSIESQITHFISSCAARAKSPAPNRLLGRLLPALGCGG